MHRFCSFSLKRVLDRPHGMKNAALSLKKNESSSMTRRERGAVVSQHANNSGNVQRKPPPSATTIDKAGIKNSSHTTTTTTTTSIIRDNPCWGSPTECSLSHLLTILQHDNKRSTTTILYEDSSYVAINKIPDLRMDGDYEATVLKLLAYWYPPPSLLSQQLLVPPPLLNNDKHKIDKDQGKVEHHVDDNDDKDKAQMNNKTLLLQRIANITQHGQVDGLLRPCHQLDYATSGVLLCASSRTAANHVRLALQERRVVKTYLALLHGHLKVIKNIWPPPLLSVSTSTSSSSTASSASPLDEVRRRMQLQEDAYRRARDKKGQNKSHTFVGYRPASSLFQQWKHSFQKKQQQQQDVPVETDEQKQQQHQQPQPKKSKWNDKKNSSKNNNKSLQLSDDDWTLVWNELNELQYSNDDNDDNNNNNNNTDCWSELIKHASTLNWKQVREQQQAFRFERAAKKYNEILSHRQKLQQEGIENNATTTLPVIFYMPDGDKSSHNVDDSDNTFYICAPLAQHTNDFDMRLPENIAYQVPEHLKVGNIDDTSLDFKPCLTKCTIKSHCHVSVPINSQSDDDDDGDGYKARNNSKNNNKSEQEQCFYPVTKVEFSLMTGRRHQLRVHSALIGHSIVGDETYQDKAVPKDISDRMCLHSHSLEVPIILENDSSIPNSSSSSSYIIKNDDGTEKTILRVQAPDPFVETEDGCVDIHMI